MMLAHVGRYVGRYLGRNAVPGFHGRLSNPNAGHVPELTGLRGIAISIIVCGHLLQRVQRFYGDGSLTAFQLDLFSVFATPFTGCRLLFCLSGYILLVSLLNSQRPTAPQVYATKVSRTLIRFWPPYAIVLVATFLFLTSTGYRPPGTYNFEGQPESLALSLVFSLVFVHDLVFNNFPRLFPPGWYIEVHIQFCVIGTLVWIAYLKIPAGGIRLAIGLLLLVLFAILSTLVAEHGSRGIQYSIVAFMPFFWIGALLADMRMQRGTRGFDRLIRRFPLAGWLVLVILILLGRPFDDPWLRPFVHIILLAMLLLCSFTVGTTFQRALSSRWLTRIGVASYSIYLVHLQILQVVVAFGVDALRGLPIYMVTIFCMVVGLVAVSAASLIFYWLIERPLVAATLQLPARASAI